MDRAQEREAQLATTAAGFVHIELLTTDTPSRSPSRSIRFARPLNALSASNMPSLAPSSAVAISHAAIAFVTLCSPKRGRPAIGASKGPSFKSPPFRAVVPFPIDLPEGLNVTIRTPSGHADRTTSSGKEGSSKLQTTVSPSPIAANMRSLV